MPQEKRWQAVLLYETQAILAEKSRFYDCPYSVDTHARDAATLLETWI